MRKNERTIRSTRPMTQSRKLTNDTAHVGQIICMICTVYSHYSS